jgi:hypothetical protein
LEYKPIWQSVQTSELVPKDSANLPAEQGMQSAEIAYVPRAHPWHWYKTISSSLEPK